LELVERVPQIIREIVESQTHARFDRSHFAKHWPAALDYETVYYVLSADYRQYMDVQEAINLRLHRALTDLGIEFAYPTQKLFVVHSAPDADTADRAAAERPDRASDAAAKPA
jgi:small-conductance mechanosensitive channel